MQKINVIVEGQLLNPIPGLPPDGGTPNPIDPLPPSLPPERLPYFRVGAGSGRAGSVVEVPVFGGCAGTISGFHFGCGCGDWETVAIGVKLSSYLSDYLAERNPYEGFQYVGSDMAVGPSAFCEYALGFFSIAGEQLIAPIPIPPDTELFRISFQLAANAQPGALELIAKDEFWATHENVKRRDYLYTAEHSGGYTKIEMMSGKLVVVV